MARGRRGDKTYTGLNSVATDRLRELDKLRVQGSGIDGRLIPPSEEAMRIALESQLCPWCGSGPFKVLAIHTGRAHGVDAAELRALAGLGKFATICAEDYSEFRADMKRGQALPDTAYGEAQRKKRSLSPAGRRSQRDKALGVTVEGHRRAARASGDKQLAANVEKHSEVVRRFNMGEGMVSIAEAVGISPATVRRTLKRAGLYMDGRARRWR